MCPERGGWVRVCGLLARVARFRRHGQGGVGVGHPLVWGFGVWAGTLLAFGEADMTRLVGGVTRLVGDMTRLVTLASLVPDGGGTRFGLVDAHARVSCVLLWGLGFRTPRARGVARAGDQGWHGPCFLSWCWGKTAPLRNPPKENPHVDHRFDP